MVCSRKHLPCRVIIRTPGMWNAQSSTLDQSLQIWGPLGDQFSASWIPSFQKSSNQSETTELQSFAQQAHWARQTLVSWTSNKRTHLHSSSCAHASTHCAADDITGPQPILYKQDTALRRIQISSSTSSTLTE